MWLLKGLKIAAALLLALCFMFQVSKLRKMERMALKY